MSGPGAICVIHQGQVNADLLELPQYPNIPEDSILVLQPGSDPAAQRNLCVINARERLGSRLEWLCFVDSDQVLSPETIPALLAISGADIISAAIHSRHWPLELVGYRSEGPEDAARWEDLPQLCLWVGLGCCLIRAAIFEAMALPWFRVGEGAPDRLTEDYGFCLRAQKEAGARIIMAPVPVGHHGRVIFWPGPGGVSLSFDGHPHSWKVPLELPCRS